MSYNRADILKIELERLEKISGKTEEGRLHFLRFQNPLTWRIWENAGLKLDSTMGFAANIGFRCGTCREFPVFDVLDRISLNLREMPLVVMDEALRKLTSDADEFWAEVTNMKNIVKKFNGKFCFLWHNNNNAAYEWREIAENYELFYE